MLMKSKELGTVASQCSKDKERLLNWQPPMFFCGQWGEKGKKGYMCCCCFCLFVFPVDHV